MRVTKTTDRLKLPSEAERAGILAAPVVATSFRKAFDSISALHCVEVRAPADARALGQRARIAFWNAERLKYEAASAELLGGLGADVLMLCELDLGMIRSQNRHTIRDLADTLGQGYVFGVEFVELGLGDLREQKAFAGQPNEAGLHGGGFVSGAMLERPALVRLETSGRWFDGAFHERRVGGRIAMLAEIRLAGARVLLASVHYESHTGPADRLVQTEKLLAEIDAHSPGVPVLIGGDFNTNTLEREERIVPGAVDRALAADPQRLVSPMHYEPMFDLLARNGYDWAGCNAMGVATQRTRPDGTPEPPFGKIDWLFSRGLNCSGAATIPAVDSHGVAISDHEVLAVTIEAA
ncbi:MAG: endonuclease/exonuclease/phosphatase family protein [Alphaproteobacteria bacterium]|nr:endonuclease/exonuclease/phosphatase family protein [Alphaproteobacteria bacterium]